MPVGQKGSNLFYTIWNLFENNWNGNAFCGTIRSIKPPCLKRKVLQFLRLKQNINCLMSWKKGWSWMENKYMNVCSVINMKNSELLSIKSCHFSVGRMMPAYHVFSWSIMNMAYITENCLHMNCPRRPCMLKKFTLNIVPVVAKIDIT